MVERGLEGGTFTSQFMKTGMEIPQKEYVYVVTAVKYCVLMKYYKLNSH